MDAPADFDEPCKECGKAEIYVDPDSGLCDVCAAVQRALDDTVTLDELRAEIEANQ